MIRQPDVLGCGQPHPSARLPAAGLHVITLTLLVPEMWVAPHTGLEVRTIAIFTTKEEPITARIGLPAAREQYAVITLDGEGRLVDL